MFGFTNVVQTEMRTNKMTRNELNTVNSKQPSFFLFSRVLQKKI